MSILNYIQNFINEGKQFRNILIYNSNVSDIYEMDEIGKLCNNVTFSFDNNFLVSSYSIRLRFNKNLQFMNSRIVFDRFQKLSFDLVIIDHPDHDLINLINQNKFVQYFIILDNSLINVSLFEYVNNGIYKRNLSKVVVDVTKEEKQYNNDVERYSALDKILNRNKEKNEVSIKHEVKNNDYINESFSMINVVNLVPHETKYNTKFVNKNVDGVLALSMIISNDDDFEKFCSCKKIISSRYENIKYYIVLNGHETLKYGKYFNDFELLIKSENKENQSFYSLFFDNCIKNEYQFNLNHINEDQLTNIWGLL